MDGGAKPLRRGTPGRPYATEKIQRALKACKERRSRTDRKLKSSRQVAREAGVLSKSTIQRWKKLDMSPEGRATRALKRGHNRLLTAEQERVAAGFVIARHNRDLSTKTSYLRLFVEKAFHAKPVPGWFTAFNMRQHLSLRTLEATKHILLTEEKRDEGIDFLTRLREARIPPERMVVMDKTKLAALHDENKEIAPTGRYEGG